MKILVHIIGFIILLFIMFIVTGIIVNDVVYKVYGYSAGVTKLVDSLDVLITLIGLIPAFIAKRKGRNFFLWYIYGWALFIIALIHSILIKPTDEVRLGEGMKKCPFCAELIRSDAIVCRYCGRDLPKPLDTTVCPSCGTKLDSDYRICLKCGQEISKY